MLKLINYEVKALPEIDWEIAGKYASKHVFEPTHVIYYKGHYPYGLFILTSGEVLVEFDRKKKSLIKAPAIIGYKSFKDFKPYPCTVTALSKCTTYFITRSGYNDQIAQKNPFISLFQDL